jgi:hypothetical protein
MENESSKWHLKSEKNMVASSLIRVLAYGILGFCFKFDFILFPLGLLTVVGIEYCASEGII